jgi:hypothetical protein
MPDPSHDEIKQDLLTNPRYAELFAAYHPEAVAKFAAKYADRKFDWQWQGPKAEHSQTEALTHLREAAYNRLWDIQRKKLFDLQCRWRAGQLTLPGLDCSFDFSLYDAAIENCPVLPPISPDELDQYCDFVRQAIDFDADVLDCYHNGDGGYEPRDWQDYDDLRLHAQEEAADLPDDARQANDPPAWYEFHNLRTGPAQLLALPDLRGPLEKRYIQAYYAHRHAEHAAQPTPPPPADARPTFLTSAQEDALEHALLHQFETPKLRRQHAAYLAHQAQQAADEQVEADFAYLKTLAPGEAVPLEAAPDWRTALRRAVVETRRQQLLVYLPQVFEAYQLREQQGISHPQAEEPQWRSTLGKHLRESLLEGRELLGEPRDFNF